MNARAGMAELMADSTEVGKPRSVSDHRREFVFSDEHFRQIRTFATAHTGINLADTKKDMVYGRLSKRVRRQFGGSFDAYCSALVQGYAEEQEFLINAITTNLTAFFRENHHFDYLSGTIVPELLVKNARSRRIRIWSAGCSSGEEPYSIAIALREAIPDVEQWDIRILATDLNAEVVAHGQVGVYSEDRIETLSDARKKRWFLRGKGAHAGQVRVRPELGDMISFKRLNLLQNWPMKGPFDAIFCRNVMIYFDKPTQARLFDRYAEILTPQGYLFVGHSESIFKTTDRFIPVGQTTYRQVPS
ncbi:CheR family methyltransferase [Nitrincola sp. MINF-07-Sa-05]|uniref:CheR family methyltransferase n=1 Tax=Nitrincola salilacus TaxID=3400273 RepID=UPI003918222E